MTNPLNPADRPADHPHRITEPDPDRLALGEKIYRAIWDGAGSVFAVAATMGVSEAQVWWALTEYVRTVQNPLPEPVQLITPPPCPPWCVVDHDRVADDLIRECHSRGVLRVPTTTGGTISVEVVRFVDLITGTVRGPEVRIGDDTLTADAALALVEELAAAIGLVHRELSGVPAADTGQGPQR
ncbi:DUF6907 domain-containing protein [Micromonospora aurantiaca (nom. illeg.)]|uniref:DUF6907 domain-containing protein n=1 Tax=Micromonospora aurantiaca (nom. illeg.) TaxID=47850 RepID=UPI003F49D49A